MLSFVAKWLFAMTALSPAIGAAAIVAATTFQSTRWAFSLAFIAVATIVLTWLLVLHVRRHVQRQDMQIQDIEQADERMLEFLVAYLLPIVSATTVADATGSLWLAMYSLAILALIFGHSNVFQFNPVLAVLGYHFYFVINDKRMRFLLISKTHFHKGDRTVRCARIGEYVRLEV